MSSSNEPRSDKKQGQHASDANDSNVHSANAWETADLGDDERRKKFLRLMGASKKEHHGRFIIGEKDQTGTHGREKEKTEELNKDLEKQFIHSQEHKITKKSHTGLGFQENKEDNKDDSGKDNKNTQSEESEKDCKPSETAPGNKDQIDRKRESSDAKQGDQSPPKKPKMMMAFVKSSD